MPCRPLSTSLVAASCGSLLSRNFAANPSNPGSNVMVTDSVAFCASAEKLGIASLGLGAARASAGASSAKSQSDMHCLIQLFLGPPQAPDCASVSDVDWLFTASYARFSFWLVTRN